MRSRGVMIIGIFLVVMGLLALISNLFEFDFSSACLPTILILMGVLVLLRPRMVKEGTAVDFILIGEYKRSGLWRVASSEIWSGVGEVKLDFSQAELAPGETCIHIYHLIGDVSLRTNDKVGLALTVNGLINSVKWWGAKQDNFLNEVRLATPDYDQAERRVKVEVTTLIGDIKAHPANTLP